MAFDLNELLGSLRFGPENTMQADPGTPSIYASPEEWQAYRDKQAIEAILNNQVAADASIKQNSLAAHAAPGPKQAIQEAPPPADLIKLSSLQGHAQGPSILDALVPTSQAPKHKKEDQINQNWNSSGITAFTDEKGQLVLTNKPGAKSAKEAMAPFTNEQIAAVNTSNPTMAGNVSSIIQRLKEAPDYASAAGVAVALNESLSMETAKIQADAVKFAEQSMGIPQLRASLVQSEAIDGQVKDQWGRPAMGDSPATKNLRVRLQQAEQMVEKKASQWLAQNSQMASLKSATTNAKLILDEKQRMFSQVEAKQLAAKDKQEQKDATLLEYFEVQPAYVFDRISKLNPEIGKSDNPRLAAARYMSTLGSKDKNFYEAVTTDEANLPELALKGNSYARNVTIAKEMEATGMSADSVSSMLDKLATQTQDPNLVDKMLKATVPANAPNRKEMVDQQRAEIFRMSNAEGKDNAISVNARMALRLARAGATQRFTDDVAAWNPVNPLVLEAVKKASGITGRADIAAVFDALIGDKAGPEAVALAKLLEEEARNAGKKYKGSLFGSPNELEIQALLANMVKTKTSWWAAMTSSMNQAYMPNMRTSPQVDSPFVFR